MRVLHLTGYDLPIEELKRFRQLHSKTPGHPEFGLTPGVETTTGPLGQGIANAVGMALAESLLAARVQPARLTIVDHHTYVFLGDGCLMEGISHEACSLAGTLGLGKLIALYDDNGISIDGKVQGWFTDDTPKRFEAYGWHVMPARRRPRCGRGGPRASALPRRSTDRPSLICCKTVIGKGSPNKAGTHDAHGAALGEKEVAATRKSNRLEVPAVRDSAERLRGPGTRARAVPRRRGLEPAFASVREAASGTRARIPRGAWRATAGRFRRRVRGAWCARRGQGRDHRHAQGIAERDRGSGSRAAGVARRLGRPDRLEPDASGRGRRR